VIPVLFDEKSGNPKLIRRAEWGTGGKTLSAQQFSRFFNEK